MRNIEFANFFLLVLFCTIALLGLANFVVRNNFIQSSVLQIGNKLRRNASATDGLVYKIYKNSSALPPSANIVAVRLFKVKPLVIWASEWHMTPTKDLRSLLEPFGVRFIEYNLDPGRCDWHDCTAQKRLKVLTSQNLIENDENLQNQFYEAYKDDPEMKSVDVVFCGYPVNLCEMFEPFNKSVLVLASTRYDVGRYSKERWDKMNQALIRYSKQPQNVIGGNNLYDAEYIKYYTGISTRHIQSFCDYTSAAYTQTRPGYLVLRVRDRDFNGVFFNEFKSACQAINCTVTATLLGHYGGYADVAAHRGIINVPYQISVMSIFEQYRMNIPLFFPTQALLAEWHHKHYIMPERTFDSAFFGNRPHASVIGPHPSQAQVPDPKNEYDKKGMEYWIKFADFYQIFPHVVYYNSTDDLVNILQTIKSEELWRISKKMEEHNIKTKKELLKEWKEILLNFAKHSRNNPH